jgi:hypothetical protein
VSALLAAEHLQSNAHAPIAAGDDALGCASAYGACPCASDSCCSQVDAFIIHEMSPSREALPVR